MADVTPLAFLTVAASIGLAALAVLRWPHPAKDLCPLPAPRVIDRDPHTLTYLGPDGRPNPARYEHFADYPSALARQREQIRHGHPSVVTHADSGEVRLDPYEMFGPFRRVGF